MAVSVTLDTLRNRVRFLGDFENSRIVTDERLDEIINANVRKVWDLLLRHRPEQYITEQSGNPATAANDATVTLAADFYRLRKVEWLDGSRYRRLRPINVSVAHRWSTAGSPCGYRIQGNELVIVPTPNAVYSLRIYYLPAFAALVEDDDEFDGINGYEDLVIALSIVDLKLRESMPFGEWMGRAEKLTRELIDAAELDAGEPFLLSGGLYDQDEEWD